MLVSVLASRGAPLTVLLTTDGHGALDLPSASLAPGESPEEGAARAVRDATRGEAHDARPASPPWLTGVPVTTALVAARFSGDPGEAVLLRPAEALEGPLTERARAALLTRSAAG